MVYLPMLFGLNLWLNVGKYSIHGASGNDFSSHKKWTHFNQPKPGLPLVGGFNRSDARQKGSFPQNRGENN